MAYMKKNVNFGFFLLLVATLICLTGLSIYYQTTFKDLYNDYRNKLGELEQVSSTLSMERTKLNQTSYQLTIKEEREKELSTQYTGLKTEKEILQRDKEKLQAQLTAKTAELFTAQNNLAKAQAELSISKTELDAAMTTISGLREDISSLETERDSLAVQLVACQSQCP